MCKYLKAQACAGFFRVIRSSFEQSARVRFIPRRLGSNHLIPAGAALIFGMLMAGVANAADVPQHQVSLSDVQLQEGTLRVHFIDVGPGMAALIQTPSGYNIFIDGGKGKSHMLRKYLHKFVPQGGVILMAIVTHPDFDHYKGMLNVFHDYEVSWFLHPGYHSDELGVTWGKVLARATEEGSEIYAPLEDWVRVCEYEVLDEVGEGPEDDVTITYLNVDKMPPNSDPLTGRRFSEAERRNNASLVFKIEYGTTSFLFTGDINGRNKHHTMPDDDLEIDSEEAELVRRHEFDPACSLQADVMQAPHHGSNGSCSLPFVRAVDPSWVVFTAGHEHNHPHPGSWRRVKSEVSETHMLRTDIGDHMPEHRVSREDKEKEGDDSFIFVSDGETLNRLMWVKTD